MITTQAAYLKLLEEIEQQSFPIKEKHKGQIKCQAGCFACCQNISLSQIEAHVVKQSLQILGSKKLNTLRENWQKTSETCPLLLEGLCTIYPHRPIICRTHGLPLGYADHDYNTIEVSACPLNFPDDQTFMAEDLFMMDSVNNKLQQLNISFSSENCLDPMHRISLITLLEKIML